MASLSRKRIIAIFLTVLVTAFTDGLTEFQKRELIARCKSKTKNTERYPNCMMSELKTTLWCDESNYTKILGPKDHKCIEANMARDVEVLLFNDSCLLGIHKGELVGYHSMKHFVGSQNYITLLNRSAFSDNKELLEIDLSDNLIAEIEHGSFEGLSQLLRLDLSNNKLNEIVSEKFRHLSSLERISLAGNSLTALHHRPFRRMKSLKILDLTGNKIASIIDGFGGMRKLEHLFLDGNRLKAVADRTFVGTPSLQTLSIPNNKIEKWPTAMGKLFVNLRVLNLSSNFIETFTFEHTAELKELRYLSLGNNSLRTIESNQFLSNRKLKFLNLSGNYIEEIPEDTFTPLEELETLLLADNMLKTPNKRWFQHLSKYNSSQVNIDGSHWECNCGIVEFEKFNETLPQTLANQLQITCSMPRFAEGLVLNEDVVDEIRYRLTCDPTPPTPRISPPSPYEPRKAKGSTSKAAETTTTTTTRKRKITPRTQAIRDLSDPSPMPDAKPLHIAIIATLCSAIIFILAAVVICCKLKREPLEQAKSSSKRKRNESTRDCLSEDISSTVLTDVISTGSTYDPHPVLIPTRSQFPRDSRTHDHSYLSLNRSPDAQHGTFVRQHSPVQAIGVQDQYFTPTTTPKQPFAQSTVNHVANSLSTADSAEASLKAGIPKRGSMDSFQSCNDFSSDFRGLNPSTISDMEQMMGNDGPPSSFQFFSIESRNSGDGAEAQIST